MIIFLALVAGFLVGRAWRVAGLRDALKDQWEVGFEAGAREQKRLDREEAEWDRECAISGR